MRWHPQGARKLAKAPGGKRQRTGLQHMLHKTGLLERLIETGESLNGMQKLAKDWSGYEIGRGSLKYALDTNPDLARRYERARATRAKRDLQDARANLRAMHDRLDDLESRLRDARRGLEEDPAARAVLAYVSAHRNHGLSLRVLHRIAHAYHQGRSYDEIVRGVHVPRSTLYVNLRKLRTACKENGIPLPERTRKCSLTEEQRSQAAHWVPRIGVTNTARKLRVDYERILYYADSTGLRRPFRGRPDARMRRYIANVLRKA